MDELQPQAQIAHEDLTNTQATSLFSVAIWALAIIAGLVVLGVMILSWFGRTVPESVVVLGSVAVGALAGMVAGEARNG